jgi:hypothetical protein
MDAKPTVFPGTVLHADSARSDAELSRDVRAHYDTHPGVRFLVDVLTALHAPPDPIRTAEQFYEAFPPRALMAALERRADLRARVLHAMTGGPPTLLRRTPPLDLAAQIELLEAEDLPPDERALRAEEDRNLSVVELYQRYLDPADLCAYLAGRDIWAYESNDGWWQRSNDATRRLLAAQIKSIRRHKILTDTELVDRVGNEVLERDLPLRVRAEIRTASRRAARDGRTFSDTDLIECVRSSEGARDLIDELVGSVPLPHLRQLVERAAEVLGLLAPAVTVSNPAPADTGSASADEPSPSSLDLRPTTGVVRPLAAAEAVRPRLPSFPGLDAVSPARPAAIAPRLSETPLVELVDDETYGEESTNSGRPPIEGIAEPSEEDETGPTPDRP